MSVEGGGTCGGHHLSARNSHFRISRHWEGSTHGTRWLACRVAQPPFPGGTFRMETSTTSSTIRVAIVEDHPFMREALADLLGGSGTHVVSQHDDASTF